MAPRDRAGDVRGGLGIERPGLGRARTDELDPVFVERVDQGDEAQRRVAIAGREPGHAAQDHRVIVPGDGEVVGGAQRFSRY